MGEKWRANVAYAPAGTKVEYEGILYELIQPHTSQMGWEPSMVPALWRVCRDQHGVSKHHRRHSSSGSSSCSCSSCKNHHHNNNHGHNNNQQQPPQPFSGNNDQKYQQNQNFGGPQQPPYGGGFGGPNAPSAPSGFGGPGFGGPGFGGPGFGGPGFNFGGQGQQGQYGQDPYGQGQQGPYGQDPYGQGQPGQYGQGPYSQDPYGQGQPGQQPPFQNQQYMMNNGGGNNSYLPYQWVPYNGYLPQNAISINNSRGKTFFVARTYVNGSIIPGYADPSNNNCFVPDDGKEIISDQFEVLICDPSRYTWTPCKDPNKLNGTPVIGGYDSDHNELYVTKCDHKGVPYFGKTSFNYKCAYFAYNKKEHKSNDFDVLTYQSL